MTVATTETNTFCCEYCNKEFRRLSTVQKHMCEPKRRANQKNEKGVVLGLQTFNEFLKTIQKTAKPKTYEDFCQSPYYSAFVKFGQFIVSVNAVNPPKFIDWIIRSKIPVDKWTKDSNYDKYLYEYLRKETPEEALERSVKEMTKWAEDNNSKFNHFFKYVNENKACQLINNGRISPWVIFNCETGIAFLEKLQGHHLELIYSIVDPEWWTAKFKESPEDVDWVKLTLKAANL